MPVENRHKRFRIDLRAEDADYFEKLASTVGVRTPTVLKIILANAAKEKNSLEIENDESKKCEECGKKTTNKKRPDPYYQDVKNEIRLMILCDECYKTSCDEI